MAASTIFGIPTAGPSSQSGLNAHTAARSRHPGGVNASLSDASVRFFSRSISQSIWRKMGTRKGGEVVSNQ